MLARLVLLVLLAILPLLGIQLYQAEEARRGEIAGVRGDARIAAQQLSDEQDRIIDGARQLLVAVSQLRSVAEHDARGCQASLSRIQTQFPQYTNIYAVDRTGRSYCAGGMPAGTDIDNSAKTWFRLAVEQRRFIVGEYMVGQVTGKPTLHLAVPVIDAAGDLVGVVAAGLSLEWLAARLATLPMPPDTSTVIADRNGTILVRLPDLGLVGQPLPTTLRELLHQSHAGTADIEWGDGIRRIVGFVPLPVPPEDLYVAVGMNPAGALAAIDGAFERAVLLSLLVAAAAFAAAFYLGRQVIRRPVACVLEAAGDWTRGNYRARIVGAGSAPEFAAIRDKLNALAERLETRDREVRELGEARRRLLAVAGHDLRQPVQLLSGFLDLLRRRVASPPDPAHLARADRAIDRITRALDAVAEVARLDAEAVKPRIQVFPVEDLLLEIEDEWAPDARKKGIGFRVVPCRRLVRSDRMLLATILGNLVANAIRYTERGRVAVGCRRRGEMLAIQVVDTGIGIPEAEFDSIFHEFRQLESSGGSGMGLGLWIVKRTSDILGHRVTIRSHERRGSCFSVEVPLAAPAVVADRAMAGGKPRLRARISGLGARR